MSEPQPNPPQPTPPQPQPASGGGWGLTLGLVVLLVAADGYTDADGDLVADTPTDPAKVLKVEEIGFTVVGSDVCVAGDLLARAVGGGRVKADQFRSIYQSEPFPPLCFGVPHDLPPDLRAKVEQAFAGFEVPGRRSANCTRTRGTSGPPG